MITSRKQTIMKFLVLALFLTPFVIFSQIPNKVQQLSKKSKFWVVELEGQYGLINDGKEIESPQYGEYYIADGFVAFTGSEHAVCYNNKGEKIIDLHNGQLAVGEIPNFVIGTMDNFTTIYTLTGKQLVPLSEQMDFEYYEDAILIKDTENNTKALFDVNGNAMVPFTENEIIYDDYLKKIAVKDGVGFTVYLDNKSVLPVNASILDKTHFVFDHEVTVGEYVNFLGSQKAEGVLLDETGQHYLDVISLIPDTAKVEAKLLPLYRYIIPILKQEETPMFEETVDLIESFADIFVSYEIPKNLKTLLNFPVTGITKYQAEKYCEWLMYQYQMHEENEFYSNVVLSLPSETEWELMAQQALLQQNISKQMPDSLNEKNCMLFVYNTKTQCKNTAPYLKNSLGGGSTNVKAPIPDTAGRSHVYGNVAEMTSEDGKAKGGSFAHSAEAAKYTSTILYEESQPWLGFRILGQFKIL